MKFRRLLSRGRRILIVLLFFCAIPPISNSASCRLERLKPCTLMTRGAAASGENLIWPVNDLNQPALNLIASPFGPRWQSSLERNDFHTGIDISVPLHTPVVAAADGIVFSVVRSTSGSELRVVIHHPALNYYTAYLHLESTSVSTGQSVIQGQEIGKVGYSGTSVFPNLHFEVRLSDRDYMVSTRNPMGYLPRSENEKPTIRITQLESNPVYSPKVSLEITTSRQELDLNQVRVILKDRLTGEVLDDQMVDFNERINAGSDTLDQNGIQLVPSPFGLTTSKYQIGANFYNLHGLDSFTLTAQAIDLGGNVGSVSITADDTTPPGRVVSLSARWGPNGTIELIWIAPGDSGQIGTAKAYEIRYANMLIDGTTWDTSAKKLVDPPVPLPGGQFQTWTLTGPFSEPMFFALQAVDAEGNRSLISNSAKALKPALYMPLILR